MWDYKENPLYIYVTKRNDYNISIMYELENIIQNVQWDENDNPYTAYLLSGGTNELIIEYLKNIIDKSISIKYGGYSFNINLFNK